MKKVLIGLLIIVALVVGINLFEDNAQPKQTQVYNLSDYAYTELENGTIYRADDLVVVDKFAERAYGQRKSYQHNGLLHGNLPGQK